MNIESLLHSPPPLHVFSLGEDQLLYGRLGRRRDRLDRVERQAIARGWYHLGPVGLLTIERDALSVALNSLLVRLDRTPQRAGIVIPNSWVRTLVVDLGALPRQRQEAEEIIRWRLKKLLPCRPEDVRLDYIPVGDNGRVLTVLALDRPLGAIEDLFAAAGVKIGRMEPSAISLTALLPAGETPILLMHAEERSLGLVLIGAGKVRLVRHKSLPAAPERVEEFVIRELARTLVHAREQEAMKEPLKLWLATDSESLTEGVARWAIDAAVAVHSFPAADGRLPVTPSGRAADLWPLLACGWVGEM